MEGKGQEWMEEEGREGAGERAGEKENLTHCSFANFRALG